jgi:hypothetical protein
MQLQRDTFNFEETAESRRKHSDEDFHDLDVSFVFFSASGVQSM